jgi:hypothetical protein
MHVTQSLPDIDASVSLVRRFRDEQNEVAVLSHLAAGD